MLVFIEVILYNATKFVSEEGGIIVLPYLALLLEVGLFYLVFIQVSKHKVQKLDALFVILPILVLMVMIFSLIPVREIAAMLGNLTNIIILTLVANRKNKILQLSFLLATLTIITTVFSGYLSGTVFNFIHGYMLRETLFNEWPIFIAYFVVAFTLAYIISKKLGNFLHKIMSPLTDEYKKQLTQYLLGGTVITLTLFIVSVFLPDLPIDIAVRNLIYSMLLATYFIYLIFTVFTFTENFRQEAEIIHNKEMLINLQGYTENVENTSIEVRRFRHDHRNLLLGFLDYIKNEDIDGIRAYYQQYLTTFIESTDALDSQLEGLKNIKNPEVKSILSSKLLLAQQRNIDVHIEVADEVGGIGDFQLVDLCRVVAILLDNAIESCHTSEKPTVKFLAMADENKIDFIFANTYPLPAPSLSQIFKEGFTTKEGGRGMGLYIASKLCGDGKAMSLYTNIIEEEFIQELIIIPEPN